MGIQNYDSIQTQENSLAIALPQVALALTELKLLEKLMALGPEPGLDQSLKRLNWESAPIEPVSAELSVNRVYLGNEFCERLLPTPAQMTEAIACTQYLGIDFSLQTPLLTDSGIKRLRILLDTLAEGTEVIVNDWGTLRLIRTDYGGLKPLLGRLLYKMIKDPRLPSAQWTRLHPHSGRSKPFHYLLDRWGVDQIEMDVPPFTQLDQFDVGDMDLSVYLPYGYVVKGRMCRIGSLGQDDASKFVAGHACRKECLDYVTLLERPRQRSSDSKNLEQKRVAAKNCGRFVGISAR